MEWHTCSEFMETKTVEMKGKKGKALANSPLANGRLVALFDCVLCSEKIESENAIVVGSEHYGTRQCDGGNDNQCESSNH